MRQRNDTDYPLVVGTEPVTVVEPGEELEHETPVAGLTVVEPTPAVDEPAQPEAQNPDEPPVKPDRKPRTPSARSEEPTP